MGLSRRRPTRDGFFRFCNGLRCGKVFYFQWTKFVSRAWDECLFSFDRTANQMIYVHVMCVSAFSWLRSFAFLHLKSSMKLEARLKSGRRSADDDLSFASSVIVLYGHSMRPNLGTNIKMAHRMYIDIFRIVRGRKLNIFSLLEYL